jgi:phosphoribosylformylglycinamidine (FGAM) synthase-like enzyme
VLDVLGRGLVDGIQDCSDGGLAVTLAELAIRGDVGAVVDLGGAPDLAALAPAEALFSESASRVVLVVDPGSARAVLDAATAAGVPAARIGTVGAPGPVTSLVVRDAAGTIVLDVEVAVLADAWRGALGRLLDPAASVAAT